MIRAGVASVTFRRLSPVEMVTAATSGNLGGIEWAGDAHVPPGVFANARTVGKMTREAGLEVVSYGSYYVAGDARSAGSPFEVVLDTASQLGAPNIRVWAGRVDGSLASASEKSAVVRDLQHICGLAYARNIRISLEYHADTLAYNAHHTQWLIREVAQPNLTTYWQPPHGSSLAHCASDLEMLLPLLENIHVFHWLPDTLERRPLCEGVPVWREYLTLAAQAHRCRYALLEFVAGDSLQTFKADAETLCFLLRTSVNADHLS